MLSKRNKYVLWLQMLILNWNYPVYIIYSHCSFSGEVQQTAQTDEQHGVQMNKIYRFSKIQCFAWFQNENLLAQGQLKILC